MKKLLSIIISGTVALSCVPALCAENTADFSDKLEVLDGLFAECEKAGIPTDYEKVNYKVIERFDSYMDNDIANGHMSVEVNLKRIDELYNEAKTNMEGYLAGTIVPKYTELSDMNDIKVSGSGFYDSKEMPAYSIGYGHFDRAANDVPNLNGFGASNIQIECGPTIATDTRVALIQSVLKNGEKYNVGVNVLLSPHYFPTDLDESLYTDKGGFIKYNIDAPETREIVENYLRTFLPKISGYKSLTSVVLSNEPTYSTKNFPGFYNPRFREYLKEIHGSIESLNAACGTSYGDFDEIHMIDSAMIYDWVMFNDKTFADWHKWMADIVEGYLPGVPKSIKAQEYFHSANTYGVGGEHGALYQGVDLELFNEFTDIAGNDALDYIEDDGRYYRTMFMYDYQSSVTGKPVYNSEDHIIKDGSVDFTDNQKPHLRNNLWMGAIHGRNMSTIWVWDRGSDASFENSILYRPECVAEAGRTNLDLNRLSLYVDMFRKSEPKTAIFYSKASRLHQDIYSYMTALYDAYKTCLNSGVKAGIISDMSVGKLSNYDTLIITNAECVTEEAYDAVAEFAANGGRVLYTGDVFSRDEYKNKIDNSGLLAYAEKYSSTAQLQDLIEGDVYLIDGATGERVQNTDWSCVKNGDKLYISVSDIEFDTQKTIYVYQNGTRLTNFKDLISGRLYDSAVTLNGYTPMLLEYDGGVRKMPEIINPGADKSAKTVSWKISEDYAGANIYFLKDGYETYLKNVTGNKFEYSENGTYIIKPLNSKGAVGAPERITIADGKPVKISVSDFEKTATGVSMNVTAKNTSDTYISGYIAVEMYDAKGNRLSGAYNGTMIAGGASEDLSVTISIPENAVHVFASFIDGKTSRNLFSNEVGKRF